jgi:hypothetical protein
VEVGEGEGGGGGVYVCVRVLCCVCVWVCAGGRAGVYVCMHAHTRGARTHMYTHAPGTHVSINSARRHLAKEASTSGDNGTISFALDTSVLLADSGRDGRSDGGAASARSAEGRRAWSPDAAAVGGEYPEMGSCASPLQLKLGALEANAGQKGGGGGGGGIYSMPGMGTRGRTQSRNRWAGMETVTCVGLGV